MVTTKISAAFTSMVNAIIIAPNTMNGERINRRRTMLTPDCTWLISLVMRVISVEVPSSSISDQVRLCIWENSVGRMKHLLGFLKNYKKESILAPLFKMLEALFELFVPLVMKKIIDVGIANGDRPYIVKMCLVMVTLGIIGLTCSLTAQYFAAKAAVGCSTKLRHALFSHIQSLTWSEIDELGTSTLITRTDLHHGAADSPGSKNPFATLFYPISAKFAR